MVKTSPRVEKTTSQTSIFISMVLDMTWRLAIVVLVPIIGGFYIDKWLEMSPVFVVTGFFLAMVGMGLVMWQTMQAANQIEVPKPKKEGK